MERGRDRHALSRWLWSSRGVGARLARLGLLPVAAAWRAGMTARVAAYRRGWLASHALPLPTIAIGNLTVGGTGKTPLAIWVARYYAQRGLVPGILLRGYGGDEVLVHRREVPGARVVADPDRAAGARQALADGAQVLVLDDAYQRLDVRRDYNIAVISADAAHQVGWPLPAGPWREGLAALERADALVVTRKQAPPERAIALAEQLQRRAGAPAAVGHLRLVGFEGMLSRRPYTVEALGGTHILAAAGIGDPEAFLAQLKAFGAVVTPATWRDHHAYDAADVAWLVEAGRGADHIVVTAKDAVKLQDRWPSAAPEPLVAMLDLEWEQGGERIVDALSTIVHSRVSHQPDSL